jgi:hypothetical protein
LNVVEQLTNCLYNDNDVTCIDTYCRPNVVLHGDGVWFPATDFPGATWAKAIHEEWFKEYSQWSFQFLDVAATAAVKGFSEVLGFFKWHANNTGSYHGLNPSHQVSHDYGIMHATVDSKGLVTDVSLWRSGFSEERQGLLLDPSHEDLITPLRDITDQPFWIPSKSLQLTMATRAHALLEVLNQGEKFLDSLDDICIQGVVLLDGMYIWGPPKVLGLPALKLWMAGWMQNYQVNAAVTASSATANSDKVFLCFRMILTDPEAGGSGGRVRTSASIRGCLLYVFNIQGFITHMVMYRSGTPAEMDAKFIGRVVRQPSTSSNISSSSSREDLVVPTQQQQQGQHSRPCIQRSGEQNHQQKQQQQPQQQQQQGRGEGEQQQQQGQQQQQRQWQQQQVVY